MFWYWLLAGPAIVLALFSLVGERRRARYVRERLAAAPSWLPPATVIVPVKGEDQGLRENLAALASLDYPDYELIVAARTAADIPAGVLPPRAKIVLAHGDDTGSSEKVQNQSAAVRASRTSSQVFAFADSDGRVTRGWLRALVAPLADPDVGVSTGYRWFLPKPATFWPLLRSVWDAVAAGLFGPDNNPFPWGGSMAMRKETFFGVRVLDYWKHAVSDDYAVSAAIGAARLRIAFAPGALVPSLEHISGKQFREWSLRQMVITRFYHPGLWRKGLAAHIVYCAGMAAAVTACFRGHPVAMAALAAVLLPGFWKGFMRARLARAALPEYADWFRRWGWAHTLLVPVATWLWLGVLVGARFRSSIEWRGYRYEFKRQASG